MNNHFSKKLICCLFIITSSISARYLTYEGGGRLGDNLLAYSRAKYFALRHGFEVLYREFPFSDQLELHRLEKNAKSITKNYKTIKVSAERDLYNAAKNSNDIFEIPYFSEAGHERRLPWNKNWIHMDINWNDKEFKKILRQVIKPIHNLNLIVPPSNCFSIAIHLRRGGNYDGKMMSETDPTSNEKAFSDINVPMKFPPRTFYIDALETLLNLIPHENIYVFLFTDDLNPKALYEEFKEKFKKYNKNILFEARINEPNNETLNVLEDLFSMLNFNALIRPESSYSLIVSHLGDFKYEAYPIAQHWEGYKSCIDKIGITVKNN